jgi:alkylhydroperoxidase/carboxymuconolactone decarboxylase family protein YurZ
MRHYGANPPRTFGLQFGKVTGRIRSIRRPVDVAVITGNAAGPWAQLGRQTQADWGSMKLLTITLLSLALSASALAQGDRNVSTPLQGASALSAADIQSVSPALGRYAQEDAAGSLWQRPQLSRRDRSMVTVAILIARGQGVDLPHYMDLALNSGVTPREMSKVIHTSRSTRAGRTR